MYKYNKTNLSITLHLNLSSIHYLFTNSVTPLDVVKIRLQAQTKGFVKGECFLYCNGLMDHVCTCLNGDPASGSQVKLWRNLPQQQLNGMLVNN